MFFPRYQFIDSLFGSDLLSQFTAGKTCYEKFQAHVEEDKKLFSQKQQKYLLYD